MFARPRALNIVLAELEADGTSGLPVLHVGPKSVVYSRADAFWKLLDDVNMSELLFGTQTFEDIVRDTFVGEAIVPHLEFVRAVLLGDSTLVGNRQIMTILNPGFHNSTPPSPPVPIPIVSAVLHKPLPVHSPIPFPHTINKITIEAPPVPQSPSLQAPPVPAAFAPAAPVPTTPATAAAAGGKLVSLWGFF